MKSPWILSLFLVSACIQSAFAAGFSLEETEKSLTVLEDGKPVLTYHFGRIDPPPGCEADPERYWRSSYIHPLYGLDGEILTQDFPPDHFHHRGLYWTWPECKVGDRKMDIWTLIGARQLFEQWIRKEADSKSAVIEVQNQWRFDDDPEPKVRETVRIAVHSAERGARPIDFHLTFENICQETVIIKGQGEGNSGKGYGGFCIRPDAARKPLSFTSALGSHRRDLLTCPTPWADVSQPLPNGTSSGVSIFQNPKNPDYPHKGWIFRHYGFLGASWPHTVPYALEPTDTVDLRYRVYIHRGDAKKGKVEEAFLDYVQDQ